MPSSPNVSRPTPRPPPVVLLGFCFATAGAVLLCVSSFQSQSQLASSSGLSGAGSVTLTLTHSPMDPATAVLFVWLMSIPVWCGYLRWKFYLTTLVAPALVALALAVWIYQFQVQFQPAGSVVLSTALWVIVGDALVFLGCALEISGVVLTRLRRERTLRHRSSGTTSARPVIARPR